MGFLSHLKSRLRPSPPPEPLLTREEAFEQLFKEPARKLGEPYSEYHSKRGSTLTVTMPTDTLILEDLAGEIVVGFRRDSRYKLDAKPSHLWTREDLARHSAAVDALLSWFLGGAEGEPAEGWTRVKS